MRKKIRYLLLAALVGVIYAKPAMDPRFILKPVDEASQSIGFVRFLLEFKMIVEQKDFAALEKHLASDIKSSFSGEDTIAGFKLHWKIDPKNDPSPLWAELDAALSLGCTLEKTDGQKEFVCPYVSSRFPENLIAKDYLVVTGADIPFYGVPDENSRVIFRESYTLVSVYDKPDLCGAEGKPKTGDTLSWRRVLSLHHHMPVCVPARYVRSPLDYRTGFAKVNGKWRMKFFMGWK